MDDLHWGLPHGVGRLVNKIAHQTSGRAAKLFKACSIFPASYFLKTNTDFFGGK